MAGRYNIALLVILSVFSLTISEKAETNKESKEVNTDNKKQDEEVKFKSSYYPYGYGTGNGPTNNAYYGQSPQNPYSSYPYFTQPVSSNSYGVPSTQYLPYGNSPYYNYPSYYQPYYNTQPYYGQTPYISGQSYPAVNYPSSYSSQGYPGAASQYTSSSGGDPFADVPTEIIDVDVANPIDPTITHLPHSSASKGTPYVYPQSQAGFGGSSGNYLGNGIPYGSYSSYPNVPTQIIDVDPNSYTGGLLKPKITVTSHSTHSGTDPAIRTQTSVVTTKPIVAKITRTIDPNNRDEPIRVSYVNGQKVSDSRQDDEFKDDNDDDAEYNNSNDDDEKEDEEPSNVNAWLE